MKKIVITVDNLGPLVDVVQCDLGQDVPVDPARYWIGSMV